MTESVLHKIAMSVQSRLDQRRSQVSVAELMKKIPLARKPHDFLAAFQADGVHAIAEVKFKSPALGVLETSGVDLAIQIARSYLQGGARAISVLTEEVYFQGSPDYLREIRKAEPDALLLMKDFVLDEYQIVEGLLLGADAILLIVALLGKDKTRQLMKFARDLNLTALVEVHDESELENALDLQAPFIGINNRNLKTLEVTLQTSHDLIRKKNHQTIFISESGIHSAAQMKQLHQEGFSGFLIGSALMTSGNPGETLKTILEEASS